MLTPSVGALQEVAGQARGRKEDVVLDVDAGLDQEAAAADRLGVLGHERALLGGGGACAGAQRG